MSFNENNASNGKSKRNRRRRKSNKNENQCLSNDLQIDKPLRINNNGVRRLMSDYKDFMRNKSEFPFINAQPLDNDIFEWHCNLFAHCGIYQGFILHLRLIFSQDYPLTPPKVEILTPIIHGNIIGGSICLDMFELKSRQSYEGWTSAYSIYSILMQVQSFLFESNIIEQDTGKKAKSLEAKLKDKNFFNINWVRTKSKKDGKRRVTAQQVYDNMKTRFDNDLEWMKTVKCPQCGHCYESPIPYVGNDANLDIKLAENFDELFQRYQNEANNDNDTSNNTKEQTTKKRRKQKKKTASQKNSNKNNKIATTATQVNYSNNNNENNRNVFLFWNSIYEDTQNHILSFLNFADLKRLMGVSKKFEKMAKRSRLILNNGVECWFHRGFKIALLNDQTSYHSSKQLILGFGITPHFFNNNYNSTTLYNQIFASRNVNKSIIGDIKKKIGNLPIISKIDVTFDLLSNNAFEQFNVRTTIFKDKKFTHWIPLYINKEHGKLSMSLMESYILRIFGKNNDKKNGCNNNNNKKNSGGYHPYLALYCVANMMKSLIVSLMEKTDKWRGIISLYHSTNVLEAYLRLHHLLLAIYYHNKKQLKPLIQDQINMFFKGFENDRKQQNSMNIINSNKNQNNNSNNSGDNDYFYECRNKSCIPDYGVFLMFLALTENEDNNNNNNNDWNNGIGVSLLDEIFTRQIRWLLDDYPKFVTNENENYNLNKFEKIERSNERRLKMFAKGRVSQRLFMFQYFFLTKVCQVFGVTSSNNNSKNNSGSILNNRVSPMDKYVEYNNNNGLLNDRSLANKLQTFVKKSCSCRSYKEFFKIVELTYPGDNQLSMWFIKCLKQSEQRGYHKPYFYESRLRPRDIINRNNHSTHNNSKRFKNTKRKRY